ncbi:MAG TPA: NB-ARC domain-containing protein [Terracidiphilus sp.]|jgi:WD40 repeat protein
MIWPPMFYPEPFRIFISYARKDGAALAQRLQSDLTKEGFNAWIDTQHIPGGAVWSPAIEREVDSRQVTLALLSPASFVSEICRAEQIRALDKGNRVIPVLAVKGADRPLFLYARQYRDFTNEASYSVRFGELLADIRGDATATLPENYRQTPVTYLTAPPRVANYLARPQFLCALRNTLFAEDDRQPIALTALAGMGGIGKTVLAKALTDDEVVQRAFPDGIVWITAGKERKRDFIEEMREVAKALGDDLKGYDTALAGENRYRTMIAQKAALIVVDDVWSKADIERLVAESPRSRFLFTTRDSSIVRFVGAHEHQVDLLDAEQARELLALWANLPTNKLPATAEDIIVQCGRLPLALSVVGAMLRGSDEQFWAATLNLLRKADLSAIEDQLPEGQQSFFKAVEVSFQSLKPAIQERYKELTVLLEDMPAPPAILQMLWNVNPDEAARIAKLLIDRSLAQLDDASKSIRLHDLQLDYLRAQFPDRRALDLIHGAIRLSAHVITRDPDQFASQIVGRLLSYHDLSAIKQFAERTSQATSKPWLRPLKATLHPPGTSLVRTLEGHTGWANGVALSGDGRFAVSASWDDTLKVWDVETGSELRTLQGHRGAVFGVALSGDGQRAISASHDRMLKLWDVETGSELRTLQGHTDRVTGVALSEDGRIAVSASWDHTLKVWDVETGSELRTLQGHRGAVFGVALSGDGRRAVSASRDRTLKVWEVETGRELRTLQGHTDSVQGVALSGDGQRAISASDDRTLKVWAVETGRELSTLQGHTDRVRGVALSEDGRRVVSASGDQTLKVWDVKMGRELRSVQGHAGSVAGVALSRDGRRAVSASEDRTLKVWDVETGSELPTVQGHTNRVNGVALSGDRRCAVSASSDRTLKVWDVETGSELRTLRGHTNRVNGVALSEDGRIAVSASWDDTLKVWDVETGCELRTLQSHTSVVTGVAVSGDGRRAVSASGDKTLKVWDVETGRELRALQGHVNWVNGVALSGDGRRAVSASGDMTLKVWDVETGRELHTLQGHADWVLGVALSGDGRTAVSASWDHTLKVWDVETGRELRTLQGHTDSVNGVALNGDGRCAASASSDQTVRVWDMETGEVIATFTCDGEAHCCAFVTDNHFIAGDAGGHVHFLRLEQPKGKY